jgi:uncharacterized membrane protein YhiD involved in acid resistance
MEMAKKLWIGLAILWILVVVGNLFSSMGLVNSAMQASQLYNQATVNFLGIIIITMLLKLAEDSFSKKRKEQKENEKKIIDQINRMTLMIYKIERRLEMATSGDKKGQAGKEKNTVEK